jgi:bifunctional non-homologous end joining protein LigD
MPSKPKAASSYNRKRRLEETPEPPAKATGDVDPTKARPGGSFVIHQHYATRLHFDLRLEMMNGKTAVLVSWAVPKGMPRKKGERTLAIHVEDHPFEYGSFSGTIPKGNYGAGEVRIFDSGKFELLEQEPKKLTFRLEGNRLRAVYHLIRTSGRGGKDEWLAILKEDERGERDPPPQPDPMLATLVAEAFDDDEWGFEPKWDGIRAIAICEESTNLISRNGKDVTVAYPELQEIKKRLVALDAMVDGEIVTLVGGSPSFEKLQSRMHVRNEREIERLSKLIPVSYVAFDLIYLDGHSLVGEPFSERRRLLEETIVPAPTVQLSPVVYGEGLTLFEAARANRLEGIVAKKLTSPYEPGRRARSWLKVKTTMEADVVVAGWSEGEGARSGKLGSLVLGAYENGTLRFVGGVGTGFTEQTLKAVRDRLSKVPADEPPFPKEEIRGKPELRRVHWVRPELVATVEFRQLTSAGKLRAPAFKGLRDDKDPRECTLDQLKEVAEATG